MMSPSHWPFIVAAYAVTVLITGAMIAWILVDRRNLQRNLDRLSRDADAGDPGRRI